MKQNTLLWIHAPGFAWTDLEKPIPKKDEKKFVTRARIHRVTPIVKFIDPVDKVAGVSLHRTLGGLPVIVIRNFETMLGNLGKSALVCFLKDKKQEK